MTSAASAYLTVTGYMKLFSSISVVIASILMVLELAKIVIAGVVVKYRMKEVPQKPFLVGILLALVLLSAVGHYGFLTSAYFSNKDTVKVLDETKEDIDDRKKAVQERIDLLTKLYNDIPDKMVTQKRQMYKDTYDELKELRDEIRLLNKEKLDSVKSVTREAHEASIIQFTAQMLGLQPDTLANLIIFVLSAILDPLALFMVSTFTSIPKPTYRKVSSRSEINVMTVKDYDVDGHSVDDIVEMSEEQIRSILSIFNSKNKRLWLASALCWREAKIQGVTMDLDFNCDGAELLKTKFGVSI
jgi:hypothetical protein